MPFLFRCNVLLILSLTKLTNALQTADSAFPTVQKPPTFSFATLGGMVFAHITKGTSLNDTDLALLAKFPIVQFDKGQNKVSMPDSALEDRFISAARQVKSANPNAYLLFYLNGMINFPDFQRLLNATKAGRLFDSENLVCSKIKKLYLR